jgi:hypothetical protein
MILTVIADLALTFPAALMALSGESGNLKMKAPKHSLVGCVPVPADKACLMEPEADEGRRVCVAVVWQRARGDVASGATLNRAIAVSKSYAAGLEIHCPGGACIKLGRNSQLSTS